MPMTEEIRRSLLQQAIDNYLAKGYRVTARDQWSVTLRREKDFNWLAFIALLGVFYRPFYARRRSHTMTIVIDTDGRIHTGEGVRLPPFPVEADHGTPYRETAPPDVIQPDVAQFDVTPPEVMPAGRYQIICICRENGAISHIGFRDEIGAMQRMTKQEAIDGIMGGRLAFFVASNGIPADVMVVGSPGHRFLKTEADDTSGNNLSRLPDCQSLRAALPSQSPTATMKQLKDVASGPMTATFDQHNHSTHVIGEIIMGKVYPYHSASSEDHYVHHDNDNCPTGKQIKEENKRLGEGGRPLCEQCGKM